MQSSQAVQHLSPGKHQKISTAWIYNGILNTQPAAPNASTYPHRCCLLPPCKNKHSHATTKAERDDEKPLNYTSVFWWDIFQTFLFFPLFFLSQQSNSPISASLFFFFFCLFPPHFELCSIFLKTHTHTHFTVDQFNSCTLHVFTSPPPVIRWERRWGVCHHPLCSEGESMEPCVSGGGWLQRGSGPGWTILFWKGGVAQWGKRSCICDREL